MKTFGWITGINLGIIIVVALLAGVASIGTPSPLNETLIVAGVAALILCPINILLGVISIFMKRTTQHHIVGFFASAVLLPMIAFSICMSVVSSSSFH